MFLTAIQRRHGLYLSVIAPTLVEKAAAGEHVTVGEYKGDSLANSNKGDRTSKHNGVLRSRPECHPGTLGWQHHARSRGYEADPGVTPAQRGAHVAIRSRVRFARHASGAVGEASGGHSLVP